MKEKTRINKLVNNVCQRMEYILDEVCILDIRQFAKAALRDCNEIKKLLNKGE